MQVCIHRARKPVGELVDAVISQSQDLIHHHDQFNDDSMFIPADVLLTLKDLLEFLYFICSRSYIFCEKGS